MGLGKRCKLFERKIWNKICSGRYPLDIHLRFFNTIVMVDDDYVIFQGESDQFLVSMGSSPIFNEKKIQFNNDGYFTNPGGDNIEPIAVMGCLPYRFRFTEEIVEECLGSSGVTARDTILYYPRYDAMVDRLLRQRNLTDFIDSSRSSFLAGSIPWPMIIIGVLLIFFIFSYRTKS